MPNDCELKNIFASHDDIAGPDSTGLQVKQLHGQSDECTALDQL